MAVVVAIAQYNDFTNSAAVVYGWVVIRDICNMFFIVILLVIAFSVILRIDGYDIKKMIPKLLIMAVLINFSRTICGLIIDLAQVIMLTFVASFKNLAGGGFVTMFGMDKYLAFSETKTDASMGISIAFGYLAAIIFLLIGFAVFFVAGKIGAAVVAGIAILAFLASMLFIKSIYEVFAQSVWNYFFHEIAKTKKEEPIAEAEINPAPVVKVMPAIETRED
jgi:hypothetical protein